MGKLSDDHSSSSSIDSCHHPPSLSSASSSSLRPPHFTTTDLSLALSISPSHNNTREQCLDWPPIKHHLRNSLAVAGKSDTSLSNSLFVKVYMEGIPIGRKLDLFLHNDYKGLIKTLDHMFKTTIFCPDVDRVHCGKYYYVLTYEDKEGDWMMVGDVPWQMFLNSVKRLKITRADRC